MKFMSCCLFLAVFLSACGDLQNSSRVSIAGGRTPDSSSPSIITQSVVAIASNSEFYSKISNPSSADCSGVILSENLILTAAHCSELFDRQMNVVVFAASMKDALKDPANHVRQIVGFERHPEFPVIKVNANGYVITSSPYVENPEKWMAGNPNVPPNDLAILKFAGGLPHGYRPAVFTEANAADPLFVTLAGFGLIEVMNAPDTGVLRYVNEINVHPRDEQIKSRRFLAVANTVDVRYITRQNPARGACPGDSGGPAIVETNNSFSVLGILSLGESGKFDRTAQISYCLAHEPGKSSTPGNLYTDLRPYYNWISTASERFSRNPNSL